MGLSIIYVRINLDFFRPTHPPDHYVSKNAVLNVSKTGHFQTHPPSHFADVMYGWSPVVQF